MLINGQHNFHYIHISFDLYECASKHFCSYIYYYLFVKVNQSYFSIRLFDLRSLLAFRVLPSIFGMTFTALEIHDHDQRKRKRYSKCFVVFYSPTRFKVGQQPACLINSFKLRLLLIIKKKQSLFVVDRFKINWLLTDCRYSLHESAAMSKNIPHYSVRWTNTKQLHMRNLFFWSYFLWRFSNRTFAVCEGRSTTFYLVHDKSESHHFIPCLICSRPICLGRPFCICDTRWESVNAYAMPYDYINLPRFLRENFHNTHNSAEKQLHRRYYFYKTFQ